MSDGADAATCSSSSIGNQALAQVEVLLNMQDIEDELSIRWRERCLRIFEPHAQFHLQLQIALQSRRSDIEKHDIFGKTRWSTLRGHVLALEDTEKHNLHVHPIGDNTAVDLPNEMGCKRASDTKHKRWLEAFLFVS